MLYYCLIARLGVIFLLLLGENTQMPISTAKFILTHHNYATFTGKEKLFRSNEHPISIMQSYWLSNS